MTGIRGDADDVLSHGFVCPKGASLRELHEDPDRLRTPLVREPGGELRAGLVGRGVRRDRPPPARRSRPSTAATRSAAYIGNPIGAQPRARCSTARVLLKALRHAQRLLSASTVDQYAQADGLGADVRQRG